MANTKQVQIDWNGWKFLWKIGPFLTQAAWKVWQRVGVFLNTTRCLTDSANPSSSSWHLTYIWTDTDTRQKTHERQYFVSTLYKKNTSLMGYSIQFYAEKIATASGQFELKCWISCSWRQAKISLYLPQKNTSRVSGKGVFRGNFTTTNVKTR